MNIKPSVNRVRPLLLVALWPLAALPGCLQTRNTLVIEQPKPLEVNLNLSGRVELVVTDARKNLEEITGQKPLQTVNPEDIGLPVPPPQPATVPASLAPAIEYHALADATSSNVPTSILTLSSFSSPVNLASEADLKAAMKSRKEAVRAMLNDQLLGESHDGLLATKGSLNADQQQTTSAENADRQQLYAAEAQRLNKTPAEVALAYYLARLGYATPGEWYEHFNKQTNQWEWAHWKQ